MTLEEKRLDSSRKTPRRAAVETGSQGQEMPFPESPRVIYQRNPLVEVICQLRFPPVLAISAAPGPASFQDAIRDAFPILQVRSSNPLANVGQLAIPAELMGLLTKGLTGSVSVYDFVSEDGAWKITLSQDALALTATAYERWEMFRERLRPAVQALEEIYRPAFYSRIGLRYKDVINRSRLGLDGVEWRELLRPPILGVLGTDLAARTRVKASDTLISLDQGQVRLQHGLGQDGSEQCYIIDADFSVESRTENQHAQDALDALNQHSGRLFRWCVCDRLHHAMEPQPAE